MLPQNFINTSLEKDTDFLEQTPQPKSSLLNGLRVLIVDDSEDCSYVLKFVLEDYQAQVKTAISAGEALKAIDEWKPHIMISDIAMPGEDGYSLIQAVRDKEALEGGFLPAVALTSYVCKGYFNIAINSGFQELITKPFEPDNLVLILLKLIQGT
jgi:CheY-like chemotaxis protein